MAAYRPGSAGSADVDAARQNVVAAGTSNVPFEESTLALAGCTSASHAARLLCKMMIDREPSIPCAMALALALYRPSTDAAVAAARVLYETPRSIALHDAQHMLYGHAPPTSCLIDLQEMFKTALEALVAEPTCEALCQALKCAGWMLPHKVRTRPGIVCGDIWTHLRIAAAGVGEDVEKGVLALGKIDQVQQRRQDWVVGAGVVLVGHAAANKHGGDASSARLLVDLRNATAAHLVDERRAPRSLTAARRRAAIAAIQALPPLNPRPNGRKVRPS